MKHQHRLILLVVVWLTALPVLLFIGCADGGEPGERAPASNLDPNVAPLTEGGWYRPGVDTSWQWQIKGTLDTSLDVELYDIDLFDNRPENIAALQNRGVKVICYFSAGSSENWREDYQRFAGTDIGKQLDEWPGENWLDVRSQNVWEIMLDRLDLAVSKGCDGVEPDNMDGFGNDTGFPLTATDQLAFNRNLANEAHKRGLAVGLKNDGDQAGELNAYFDFSLNEQCHQYVECDQLQPFIDAGKPVLNAEYTEQDTPAVAQALATQICPLARGANLRTLILPWELDGSFRVSCDDTTRR